jgi:hypothetical protein
MVVGTSHNGAYGMYRCPPVGDCTRRVTISADLAESVIVAAVQERLQGMRGEASVTNGIADAEKDLEASEHELDAAVRAFTGLDDVDATRERLAELRDRRDQARDRVAELRAAVVPAITVTAGDWNLLNLDERRARIRAVVAHAVVRPGRGADRITVELRGE